MINKENNKLVALYFGIFTLIGGLISRLHGGGFFYLPKILKNILWALPFGLVAGYFSLWLGFIAFIGCLLKATGHGRGLGLDEPLTGNPEKVEYLIGWLQPHLTDHAYKHVIMASTGLLAVSGGVVAFSMINAWGALIIASCGILKGVAYEIGIPLAKKVTWWAKTEWGEFLTGVFAYGGLAIGFVIS